jgi:hypothetical protein
MNCIKELKNKYKMNYITYQNIFLSGLKFYNIDSPNFFIKSAKSIENTLSYKFKKLSKNSNIKKFYVICPDILSYKYGRYYEILCKCNFCEFIYLEEINKENKHNFYDTDYVNSLNLSEKNKIFDEIYNILLLKIPKNLSYESIIILHHFFQLFDEDFLLDQIINSLEKINLSNPNKEQNLIYLKKLKDVILYENYNPDTIPDSDFNFFLNADNTWLITQVINITFRINESTVNFLVYISNEQTDSFIGIMVLSTLYYNWYKELLKKKINNYDK